MQLIKCDLIELETQPIQQSARPKGQNRGNNASGTFGTFNKLNTQINRIAMRCKDNWWAPTIVREIPYQSNRGRPACSEARSNKQYRYCRQFYCSNGWRGWENQIQIRTIVPRDEARADRIGEIRKTHTSNLKPLG